MFPTVLVHQIIIGSNKINGDGDFNEEIACSLKHS